MRILTPTERRQIELLKNLAVKQESQLQFVDRDGDRIFLNQVDDREFWLNVLSLALAQNDALMKEWREKK